MGETVASLLTGNDVDDAGRIPDLLGQIEGAIVSVTADGGYHGEANYRAITSWQPGRPPTIVMPPRSSPVRVPSRHARRG